MPVLDDDGQVVLDHDEHPRPETTAEGLASLKPSFQAMADYAIDEQGTTPSVASSTRNIRTWTSSTSTMPAIRRASSMARRPVLLASPDYAAAHGLKARGRVVAVANIGDDPTLMLNAPVPAAKKVLEKAGLTVDDIDLWEINEAFAVVAEKFIRDLKLDRSKVNVNGGSIALGHPIGATGAILIGTLLDELERQNLKRGLVTMCAAGGMAPAIIIERV